MKIFTKKIKDLFEVIGGSINSEVEACTPNESIYGFPEKLSQTIEGITERNMIKSDFDFDISKLESNSVLIKVPIGFFSHHEQLLYDNKSHLDCHAVNYKIPFKGNSNLLNYFVSNIDINFVVEFNKNSISFQIRTMSHEKELSDEVRKEVKEKARVIIAAINQQLNVIKVEVEGFNRILNPYTSELFENRRTFLEEEKAKKESLNPFK